MSNALSDLSAERIISSLTMTRLGRPTLFFTETGSTNDVALAAAARGAGDGLLVVAETQTVGRGRLGRTWWAPAGSSLLMSLLLRPPISLTLAAQLTMCLGLGAAEGIEDATGIRPGLKWPNDLVYEGRKLGGMLSELRSTGDRIEYAVLGLGINVNVRCPGDEQLQDQAAVSAVFPQELASGAVSLSSLTGRRVDRVDLLTAILPRCEGWYARVCEGASVHEVWAEHLDTLGRKVQVTTPNQIITGIAAGVNREGALLVRGRSGELITIWSGDVETVRPQAD